MSMLAQILTPVPAAARNARDERWWGSAGALAAAGVRVTPEAALRASAVWACVRLISETIAALPVVTYRRLPGGSREPAPDHPNYDLLHQAPNREHTALEWLDGLVVNTLVRGNAYNRKVPGPRGPVDQLEPLHPDLVRPERLPNGQLRYQVRDQPGAAERPVLREDLFVVRGLSLDGMTGVSVVEFARESIGLALAAEGFGARLFSQDARPGGVLEVPGKLSAAAAARLQATWQAGHAGLGNAHKVAILEDGMSWKATSMTSEDAQFLQTREFQIADIARWFRVPLHMIGETSKATSWGSGIEQLSIGFVVYTLLPWLRRLEQAIMRDLMLAPRQYFAEFVVAGLLRGDTKTRHEAYAIGRQWGWLSVNDIRRLENMNPVEGGDAYLQPLNMAPQTAPPPREQRALLGAHYRLLVEDAAARVVRRESAAMSKAATRCAADAGAWRAAVREFYVEHVDYVAAALHLPRREAAGYAERQQAALLADGVAALADWERRCVGELVALATGEEEQAA